jgi:hypothetical protein
MRHYQRRLDYLGETAVTPSLSARLAKAAELRLLHDRYDSWRDVQSNHYPSIPAGTLCAIAKGKNIPAKHYRALGLLGERRKRTETEKRISKMARQTKKAVLIIKKTGER